jgi:predicted dehydrogenase
VPSRDDVSLAFAGAGWIAAVHGYAVDHVPGATIRAVASRDPERAIAAARRVGAKACRYDQLPAGARGVVVCTPPASHAALALTALAGGAGVLVEKPLCTTLEDADLLVEAAERGGLVAYAENLVHAPAVDVALGHAAELQGLEHIDVRCVQPRPTWGDFLTEGWGGGVLFDLGAHPLAIALLLAAPARPVQVRAVLEGADDHPVDEDAEVWIRFDSGAEAHVHASWRGTERVVWDAQASSPDGVVRLELLPEVLVERNGAAVALPPAPPGMPPALAELGYLGQLQAFVDDLRANATPGVGAAFGRSVLDLTCAAYDSAGKRSRWTKLPYRGPRHLAPIELWRR